MSRAIRISFGPCDPLNPECGYEFTAESAKGVEMRTGIHPDTQEQLTAQDCIELARRFHDLDRGDDYKAGRDAGTEEAAMRCEKSGHVNGAYHAALIRRDCTE